jgi:hypothetical protein
MSSDRKTEPYYLKRGEEIIDAMFDNGYFNDDVKRDDLRKLDDLIGYMMQSSAESAVNIDRLTRKIRTRPAIEKKANDA